MDSTGGPAGGRPRTCVRKRETVILHVRAREMNARRETGRHSKREKESGGREAAHSGRWAVKRGRRRRLSGSE